MNPLLDVKNLYVRFKTPDGVVTAVNDLNFTLNAGSTLGIVGEKWFRQVTNGLCFNGFIGSQR